MIHIPDYNVEQAGLIVPEGAVRQRRIGFRPSWNKEEWREPVSQYGIRQPIGFKKK